MIIILSCFFLLLSIACTKLFCNLAQNSKLIDRPNNRTLHTNPTVRGGGLVFIGLSLLSIPFLCYVTDTSISEWLSLSISVTLLAIISFMDDLNHLSVKTRFGVQCIVALIISIFLKPEHLDFVFFTLSNSYIIFVFIFFAVIWAINHFNFMDGLDGFCASQALFLLGAYFILLGFSQAFVYQDFCLILISSLLAFLMYNFPPAKLFMGDVGSASLGLIIFSLALIGQQKYQIPFLYWFMLNGLFLFDSTITLIRRIMNREKWSLPHKKHAYQRLKQYGIDTRWILLGQLVINILIAYLVLSLFTHHMNIFVALFIFMSFLMSIYLIVEKLYPMNRISA